MGTNGGEEDAEGEGEGATYAPPDASSRIAASNIFGFLRHFTKRDVEEELGKFVPAGDQLTVLLKFVEEFGGGGGGGERKKRKKRKEKTTKG